MSTPGAVAFKQYRVENETIVEVVDYSNMSGFQEARDWIERGDNRDVYLWRAASGKATEWWLRNKGPVTPQGTHVWQPLQNEQLPKFLQMKILIGAL